MAIAIAPQNSDITNRKSWLTMAEADNIICKHLGVEPTDDFYQGWFNRFYFFDWVHTEKIRPKNCNFAYPFKKKEIAKTFCICSQLWWDNENYSKSSVDSTFEYIDKTLGPIIDAIYDEGYMILSVNIG